MFLKPNVTESLKFSCDCHLSFPSRVQLFLYMFWVLYNLSKYLKQKKTFVAILGDGYTFPETITLEILNVNNSR